MEITHIKDYNELKKHFSVIKNEFRTVPFYHMDGDISDDDEIVSQINGFKKSGYGGLALLPVSETVPAYGSEEFYEAYGHILEKAKKAGMSIIYYDDLNFPSGWAGGELAKTAPEALSKILTMREYECAADEHVHRKLDSSGTTMSVVALDLDTHETIDLREYVSGEFIDWTPPKGNWDILQFICKYDPDSDHLNLLSYEASLKFIALTYKRFADRFDEYIGDTVNMTFYDDIQFRAQNRRSWDDGFNALFEEMFDLDPAPYYPALYMDIGPQTSHMRAMFMNCRSCMIQNGFFKAVSDFTKAHGLISTGHVAESKTVLSPWLFGDGMMYQKLAGAPGLDLVHSYVYGYNGLKLASSSAYNFDKEIVTCEIYGNYKRLDKEIIYREAMNAFARGVNFLIPHTLWYSGKARIPHEVSHRSAEFKDMLPAFNDYAARVQTVLRGGRHICDTALLYPIYSLQAQTNLYEQPAGGFEFPLTPTDADYMTVINFIMNYSIHDLTIIHPEVLSKHCYAEDGILYLSNEVNFEQFRLLVIPGTQMISIKNLRMIKKFYDDGGKIIATTVLPSQAFEFDPEEDLDSEVNEIVRHIFGVTDSEINSFKEYYGNTNENGGEAYFILSAQTAADGTDMVDCAILNSIIDDIDMSFDVVVSDPPRIANSGLLNMPLPAFMTIRDKMVGSTLPKISGAFNYIHKKYAGTDIYFIANSTNSDYDGNISLKGSFSIEEWNPYNGKIKKLQTTSAEIKNEAYTQIELQIEHGSSTILVAVNK